MQTNNVKNLGENYIYAVENPYVGNGLITSLAETTLRVVYDAKIGGPFTVGETVTSGGFSGIVAFESNSDATGVGYLLLDNTVSLLDDDDVLTGGDSGATASVNGVPAINIVENTRGADDVYTPGDAQVVVRAKRSVKGTGADTVLTLAQEITYTGKITGPYTVGETVTEATSLATGVVVADSNSGATGSGVLTLSNIVGTFTGGEVLTGGGSGATSNGVTYTDRQATFADGASINTGVAVTIGGIALSPILVTGGSSKNCFEVLRGIPAYSNSDYISYVTAKSNEPSPVTIPVRDKGVLRDRKTRPDVELRLSLTTDYENDFAGLSAMAGRDIVIIAVREDDRGGLATETQIFLQIRINTDVAPEETEGDTFSNVTVNPRYERSYILPS